MSTFDLHRNSRTPEQIVSATPEAEGYLAAAVIAQAFRDSGFLGAEPTDIATTEQLQAVQFLTTTRGGWAEARNEWANAAGMDGDFVRELAIRVSKQQPRPSTKHRPQIINASRGAVRRGAGPARILPATVEALQTRLAALDAAGIDIRTAPVCDVAKALNDAGLKTRKALTYDRDSAGALRVTYRRCVEAGAI